VKGIVNIPGENCPGYTLPENSRNRKQEKNDEHCFVNRVGVPFNFKTVPLNLRFINNLEITQFKRKSKSKRNEKIFLDCIYIV